MNRVFYGGIMVVSLLLGSCAKDSKTQALVRYINDIKHNTLSTIHPNLTWNSLDNFKYPSKKKNSSPFIQASATLCNKNKQLMKDVSIQSLKWAGTLQQGKQVWALITSQDNQLRHVGVGDFLGKECLRVLAIHSGGIELEKRERGGL